MERQQAAFESREKKKEHHLFPLDNYATSVSETDEQLGLELIKQRKVGCVILAGGEGTRLGIKGPKGTFPISVIKKKSLFQIFFEKSKAASQRAGCTLPLAIMTSPINHEESQKYLRENNWFGCSNHVALFSQQMMPVLDEQGQVLVGVEAPNGNGSFFKSFFLSNIWAQWQQAGVEYINIILVDNPLADPFDAALIGLHARMHAQATVKAVVRENTEEQVGLIVKEEGRIHVVEYSEISEQDRVAHNDDGSLKFALSNTGLFCFSMDVIPKIAAETFPLHLAHKKYKAHWVWKCETFLFDCLDYLNSIQVVVFPKEQIFAPLKNSNGLASVHTVQQALLESDRRIYFKISGIEPPDRKFELSQEFYYPTAQLLKEWKGKPLPNQDYITADS